MLVVLALIFSIIFFFVIYFWRQCVTFSDASRQIFHQSDLGTCSVFIILNANALQFQDDSPKYSRVSVVACEI